jgi:tRNA pseudouridine13 synthase
MKLKQSPDDFQVEEITDVSAAAGPFALYRLEKRGWTTPDALAAVQRRWGIEPGRLSFGGLKDRHAWTTQHLTILHGPRRGLRHQTITLHYLGQIEHPFTSRDIRANRFRITVRQIDEAERDVIAGRLGQIAVEGVPNYFDDQRFGSVTGQADEFIARLLIRGQFEEALRLALTAPYEFDRTEQKREKELLRRHWGEWALCQERLPRGPARHLVEYLRVHPGDFRGAMVRLRPELRGLYLSAYQSHLWNGMLALWLRRHCRPEQLTTISLRLGQVPMHCGLDAEQLRELASLSLPLPSARLKLEEGDPRAELVHGVLAEEGLTLREMQVRGVRELFFSRGERAALCVPFQLTHQLDNDEQHRGRLKLQLSFELARGCYATLIVKGAMGDR